MTDLGIIFLGGGSTVQEITDLAVQAEAANFSSLYMAEAWRSGWVSLTAMAAVTKRIRLGPYVLNAYGRSPLLAGMSAIDFNEFSNGRLLLGVGGGNRHINEEWQGIPHARVLTKMREYVTALQGMARTRIGERFLFEGEIHQMDWVPAVDPLATPYPVYLAAVFPRMMTVAAQTADGIAGGATLSPDYIATTLKPQIETAASAVKRDPQLIKFNTVAVTAVHSDREFARRAAREAICHFYAPLPHPYYEFTMREQGFGSVADELLKLMPAGELERAIKAIPDECVDQLTISGTIEDCRDQIAAYEHVVDELILLNVLPVDNGMDNAYRDFLRLPG